MLIADSSKHKIVYLETRSLKFRNRDIAGFHWRNGELGILFSLLSRPFSLHVIYFGLYIIVVFCERDFTTSQWQSVAKSVLG